MEHLLWLLKWMLKAAIFFVLFAFALNNQQEVQVNFFFGSQWRTSLVLAVLMAFAAGLTIGALGMVPRWWQQRRAARRAIRLAGATARPGNTESTPRHDGN